MKSIKRLAGLIRLSILSMLLKLLIRFRFINPLNWFKKKQARHEETLRQAADELKPILMKVGQTLSAQPEVLHTTLTNVINTLHDIIPPAANEKTITIIEQPQEDATSADSILTLESEEQNTPGLEQQLKTLFSELNSSHFTGDKVTHQIGALIGKGLKFAQQLNEPIQPNETRDVEAEWQTTSSEQWDDFINEVDELSLSVERLQAHINQLMSCYEIN